MKIPQIPALPGMTPLGLQEDTESRITILVSGSKAHDVVTLLKDSMALGDEIERVTLGLAKLDSVNWGIEVAS